MASRNRPAFVLLECGIMLAVACILLALLASVGGNSRRLARLGEDLAKLRQVGAWTGSYAADNVDAFWSYSWKKGQSLSQWPELNNATSDVQATSNQAIDILRRVGGRFDITPIAGWVPHVLYNHLVLEDYLATRMPDLVFISAADKHRLAWARDPTGFDAGLYSPAPFGGTNERKRWSYSASFIMPTAFYDTTPVGGRISQHINHNLWSLSTQPQLGGRQVSLVGFPAQKVLFHDRHARHFGPRVPFASLSEARLPLLFADGSVVVRTAGDSNAGWLPNTPASASPTTFIYQPNTWEPPTLSGGASDPIDAGRFAWTRGTATEHGIVGRDFGGPETCSGQPGCP